MKCKHCGFPASIDGLASHLDRVHDIGDGESHFTAVEHAESEEYPDSHSGNIPSPYVSDD